MTAPSQAAHRDGWRRQPAVPIIDDGDVHVWRVSLQDGAPALETLRRTLSRDEQQRAARFRFEKDRDQFIIARGVLRIILGRHLAVPASTIRFVYGEHGKPALNHDMNADWLHFNLSHAHGLALVALTRGRAVGVDIERIREDMSSITLAEHFFSPAEASALGMIPEPRRTEAFFACWTRKESYIKGLGEGLSHPLDSFTVTCTPGEAVSLASNRDPRDCTNWSLAALDPGGGYAAAVAVEGALRANHRWQWDATTATR